MEEITVNNILLAEFLGWGFNVDYGMFKVPHLNEEFNMDSLQFHSDWNWLMEVVEKIESLPMTMVLIGSKIIVINTHDKYKNELKTFQEGVDIGKIEASYNACVEFVKWYNNENK